MDLLFGLVGCRVEFDEGGRLGDNVPTGNIGQELLSTLDPVPEGGELGLVESGEVGERIALGTSIGTAGACREQTGVSLRRTGSASEVTDRQSAVRHLPIHLPVTLALLATLQARF